MGLALTDEEIRLAMPASPEFVRLARLTAAGVASRVRFTYDEVEDLRIAVGEACSLLIGSEIRPGNLELVFRTRPDEIVIEVRAMTNGAVTDGPPDGGSALSAQILESVVDHFEVGPGAVVLRKRRIDRTGRS